MHRVSFLLSSYHFEQSKKLRSMSVILESLCPRVRQFNTLAGAVQITKNSLVKTTWAVSASVRTPSARFCGRPIVTEKKTWRWSLAVQIDSCETPELHKVIIRRNNPEHLNVNRLYLDTSRSLLLLQLSMKRNL